MIITLGEFEVDPDQVSQLLPGLQGLMAKTRTEEGCIIFNLLADPTRPGVITVAELWEDMETLKAHLNAAHVRDFHAKIEEIGIRRFDVSALDGANRRDAMELIG